VSEKNPCEGVPQFSNITGLVKLTRERLIGARLQAVRLKAARLKAARLKAVMGFSEKLKSVSRGVRKHEHPTDRGVREDGCGV